MFNLIFTKLGQFHELKMYKLVYCFNVFTLKVPIHLHIHEHTQFFELKM